MLVRESDCGAVAYARLVRDKVVLPLLPDVALPRDIPDSPGMRALALAPYLPNHGVLSGLAGLWVHGCGVAPGSLLLVGERGTHRRSTVGVHARHHLNWHAGAAFVEARASFALPDIARAARCAADALRWEEADEAVHRVAEAIEAGMVAAVDVRRVVEGDSDRGRGYLDMVAAWRRVAAVTSPDDARW